MVTSIYVFGTIRYIIMLSLYFPNLEICIFDRKNLVCRLVIDLRI